MPNFYIPQQKFSGLLDTVFKQVDKYLPLAIGVINKPKTQSTQAKGLAAIQAAGNQVISALQQIANNPLALGSLENAIAQAEQVAATLSNTTYFYQAKSGKDKDALDNFKSQAQNIISQMKQSVNTNTPNTNNTNLNSCYKITVGGKEFVYTSEQMARYLPPQNAIITPVNCNQSITSTDDKTLYYGIGAAVVLAFILSRRK